MITKFNITMLLCLIVAPTVNGIDYNRIGTPFIKNFERTTYNASTQNWCIEQDNDNIMWFGNSGTILWFDGIYWGRVDIPNNSVVRSLELTSGNTIIAGAFAEFGSIERDDTGEYYYNSWVEKIPARYRNFTDVWGIHELNNTLYVQTIEYLFTFRDGEFSGVITPERNFNFCFVSNGTLFIEDTGIGLKAIYNGQLQLAEGGWFFADKEVWYIDHMGGNLMAGTQKNGIFIFTDGMWKEWQTSANSFVKQNSLYCAIETHDGHTAFGTVSNGLIITDSSGNIQKLINTENGLQNNTVLSIALDHEGNLWLGLDKGIAYIKINSPLGIISPKSGLGTGYAAALKDSVIYLGTNQGVFTYRQDEFAEYVTPLEGTAGQVWSFFEYGGNLYCTHHNGLFRIEGDRAFQISKIEGCWKTVPVPDSKGHFIMGTYNGLYSLDLSGENPVIRKIDGFNESCRILEFDDDGNLWMSHGYKGVYRLSLNIRENSLDRVSFFGSKHGLPSDVNNELVKIDSTLLIATADGFYKYNEIAGIFEKNSYFNNLLPVNQRVTKIIQDPWGRMHIFTGDNLSVMLFSNNSLLLNDPFTFSPVKNSFIESFENILFINKSISLIGSEDGFIVYNRDSRFETDRMLKVVIKSVETSNKPAISSDSWLETDFLDEPVSIPYKFNNIRIELAVPVFESPENISLSYTINDTRYTLPAGTREIIIPSMREGDYKIIVTAADITGTGTSGTHQISFSIDPPWYRTWYSYLAYLLILVAGSVLITGFLRRKIEKIKQKEKIIQERKMIHKQISLQKKAVVAEQELTVLRNEKLKAENRHKAKQIANSTMELVQKNKILLNIREMLSSIQSETDIEKRNSIIRGLLTRINRDLNNEENWKIFEKNFDEVHENFLNRLKEKHPELTSKDLRLCAYLRMNLSSKEIAPLLRISVRSVEISRYRMRKKIDLPHGTSLSDYILSF